MNSIRLSVFVILFINFSLSSHAQSNVITYDLKKGEAFDFLFLTTRKGSAETFKEYRQNAFPVAAEMSYSPLPGFKIKQVVQGKYEPKGMVLGKWNSIALREQFLEEIDERVPNFHEMRKKIWPLFSVTYYEVPKDFSFQLDMDKVVVATACWQKKSTSSKFESSLKQWKDAVKETNGTIKVTFNHGKSPEGYVYNPDYMMITQWNTQEDFEAFQKKNLQMEAEFLRNVNQFVLDK